MNVSVQVVAIALAALFVGLLIPVLLSLRALMVRARKAIDSNEKRLQQLLDRTIHVVGRADSILDIVQQNGPAIHSMGAALQELSQTAQRANRSLRTAVSIGAAVGPVVAAAVQSLMSRGGDRGEPAPQSDAAAAQAADASAAPRPRASASVSVPGEGGERDQATASAEA